MWLKKLKQKKKQFFFVGIMLVAIAVVFCTCICFTLELRTYANNRFSEEYCPDAYVYSKGDLDQTDNFSSVSSNIESVSSIKGKYISGSMKHNSTSISSIINMVCTLNDDNFKKYIQIVDGDMSASMPGDEEIWIPKTLASSYNIKIGDALTVNYDIPIKLKVTGIYTSTFAPSERLTIIANIVNNKTLEKFVSEPDAGIFALNLYNKSEDKITELSTGNPYSLQTFSRAKVSNYITGISGVVGGVSAVAALFVFFAALFIIRFIINNDLQKEFRSIGIYKSLGYSSKTIIRIYIKAYILIAGIAITMGSLMALLLAYNLGQSTTEVLGGFKLTKTSAMVCIGSIILLIMLLWSGAMLSLRKIKKITPVQALSAVQDFGKEKFTHSVIKNAKTPLAMEINSIFKYKKSSIVTVLVLTISMYLILFFTSSYYTCSNIYKDANKWIASPKFNSIITGNITNDVVKSVKNSDYAQSEMCGNIFYYPPATLPQYSGNPRNIEFIVLDNLNEDVTGIKMKVGFSPIHKDEIAVSKGLLSELNMQIGDYLKIGITNKQEKEFLISGTFDSMEEQSIMMSVDEMKGLDQSYQPGYCFVTLKNSNDFKDFEKYIEENHTDIDVTQEFVALKSAMVAIENMLTSIMKVMLIVFIVFAVVSIVNVLALTISGKKRRYGILRSLGFTSRYMIAQNLCYIFILLGVSTVVAIILHLILSKSIFALVVIDVMTDSIALSTILVSATALLIIGVTVLLSLPIRKITPVDLMED